MLSKLSFEIDYLALFKCAPFTRHCFNLFMIRNMTSTMLMFLFFFNYELICSVSISDIFIKINISTLYIISSLFCIGCHSMAHGAPALAVALREPWGYSIPPLSCVRDMNNPPLTGRPSPWEAQRRKGPHTGCLVWRKRISNWIWGDKALFVFCLRPEKVAPTSWLTT